MTKTPGITLNSPVRDHDFGLKQLWYVSKICVHKGRNSRQDRTCSTQAETPMIRTFRPLQNQNIFRYQSVFKHRFLTMSTSLTKGLGPQDHRLIGKAAELPGVATGQYVSIAPVSLPAPGRPIDLQMRITAPATGKDLPIILLSHGAGPSNNLSSLNGYLPTAQYYAAHGFVVIQQIGRAHV